MSDFNTKFPHQAPIRAKAGEYEQDGKTKTRYITIGQAFASPNRHHILMRINAQPLNWDGSVYLDFEDEAGTGAEKFKKAREQTGV